MSVFFIFAAIHLIWLFYLARMVFWENGWSRNCGTRVVLTRPAGATWTRKTARLLEIQWWFRSRTKMISSDFSLTITGRLNGWSIVTSGSRIRLRPFSGRSLCRNCGHWPPATHFRCCMLFTNPWSRPFRISSRIVLPSGRESSIGSLRSGTFSELGRFMVGRKMRQGSEPPESINFTGRLWKQAKLSFPNKKRILEEKGS